MVRPIFSTYLALRYFFYNYNKKRYILFILHKRTRGGSLVIEFITHKHQSSFAMSLTIFPSLTTIFTRGGHHSPPHPTISPQPTNTLTNQNHNA
ncbi:hypothetical protein Hanom_Chr09g00854081 [Helianthus anomalus]